MTKIPTLLETLKKGKKRVEAGWTQGVWARAVEGQTVDPDDSRAVEWCASGAIKGPNINAALHWLSHVIQPEIDPMKVDVLILGHFIVNWNNEKERTQEEVLEAFDLAIELARKAESNEKVSNAS